MSKSRFTPKKKIKIIEGFRSGELTRDQIRAKYKVNPNVVYDWIVQYDYKGKEAFMKRSNRNTTYSKEFKLKCVLEYLNGPDSIEIVAAKNNVSHSAVLHSWIKKYNANMELTDYGFKRSIYMAKATRKTSMEERKEIVEYCIDNDYDYSGAAMKYKVSYNQVNHWVQKYKERGYEGLSDKRGRRKPIEELSETEKLKREIQKLERQLEKAKLENEVLKKLKELERCGRLIK